MKIIGVLGILLFNWISCDTSNKETGSTSSPNIILFMVDDMGWQDTSVPFWTERTPWNDIYRTPNMERLAAKGLKFTQAYATPVCSPSRVSLMTGMNAARHRVTNWTLRPEVMQPMETNHEVLDFPFWNVNGMTPDSSIKKAAYAASLPQLLSDNGYHTIHVGKAHLGAIGTPASEPLSLGFDVNIAGHAAGAPKSYYGKDNFGNSNNGKDNPWGVPGLEKYHGQDIFLTEALTQEAIGAITKPIQEEQPFFLYMAPYAIHTPIMGNTRYLSHYYDMGLDSVEAKYASLIESMDAALGDLMNYVEAEGVADNTIILFMSDNGGLSAHTRAGALHTHNAPLSSGKGSIHEGGIREPMLAYLPGESQPNSETDDYVIIEDFYPTILELAGIENYKVPQMIDGKSFVNILKGKSVTNNNERPLFWHYPNEWGPSGPGVGAMSAIRKGDYKLIYYHQSQKFELFNITNDIGESNNLADKEPRPLGTLALELENYLKDVDAQMPSYKSTGQKVPWPAEALGADLPKDKEYQVYNIGSNKIELDGHASESVWNNATNLTDFNYSWRDVEAPLTAFKALYDNEYLYFFYHVTDIEVVAPSDLGDKDANVLGSDRVELFFRSANLEHDYVALEIDSKGRIFDSKNRFYHDVIQSWNYNEDDIQIATTIGPEGYNVEGRITLASLKELGYINNGEIITGLYRGEYKSNAQGKKEVTWISWIDVPSARPDFHIPCSFGKLILN